MTTINERILNAIESKKDAEMVLQAAENAVRDAKRRLIEIEEEILPNILDEAEIQEIILSNGIKVKYIEKVYTTLKKVGGTRSTAMCDASKAIEELISLDINPHDFFECVEVSTGDGVENMHRYSPARISALGKELLEKGQYLNPDCFSQYVKRGVKITEKGA